MKPWMFWAGLYLGCVAAGVVAMPDFGQALGFALVPLGLAAGAAWLIRRQPDATRRLTAIAVAGLFVAAALVGAANP